MKRFFIDFSYRLGHQVVFYIEPEQICDCTINGKDAYKMTLSSGEEFIIDKECVFDNANNAKFFLEDVVEKMTIYMYMNFEPISLDLESNILKIGENNE